MENKIIHLSDEDMSGLFLSGFQTIKTLSEVTDNSEKDIANKILFALTKNHSFSMDVCRWLFIWRLSRIKVDSKNGELIFDESKYDVLKKEYERIFKIMDLKSLDLFLRSGGAAQMIIKKYKIQLGDCNNFTVYFS